VLEPKKRHPIVFSANIAAYYPLRWLLVASTADAARPLTRPVRDTRQAYLVSWTSDRNCASLIDVYVAGGTAVTVARRIFRNSSCTSTVWTRCYNKTSYSARLHSFVHTMVSLVIGGSGITSEPWVSDASGRTLLYFVRKTKLMVLTTTRMKPSRAPSLAVGARTFGCSGRLANSATRPFRWRHCVFQDS
jgi:hypothetical protein